MAARLTEPGAAKLRNRYGILFFPRVQDSVAIENGDAMLERLSQHRPGQFMPLGAYSYSKSFFKHVSRIGRYCSIGEDVSVMKSRHPLGWVSANPVFYRPKRARVWSSRRTDFPPFDDYGPPVEIENDVWIGDGVLLAHGVKLGTGSVIAARSIVTRDVPPYAIVGGSPARFIRWRFDEAIIDALLASQWWNWPISAWDDTDPRDISGFLETAKRVRDTQEPLAEDRLKARRLVNRIEKKIKENEDKAAHR